MGFNDWEYCRGYSADLKRLSYFSAWDELRVIADWATALGYHDQAKAAADLVARLEEFSKYVDGEVERQGLFWEALARYGYDALLAYGYDENPVHSPDRLEETKRRIEQFIKTGQDK